MSNIINLSDAQDPDGDFQQFVDRLKTETVRGAYISIEADGQINVGLTEKNKATQLILLYQLKKFIEDCVSFFPDPDFLAEVEKEYE